MNWIFYLGLNVAFVFSFSQAQARFIKPVEAKNVKTECTSGNCGEDTASGGSPATQVNNKDLRDVANKVRTQAKKDQAVLEKQIADYSNSAAVKAMIKHAVRYKRPKFTGQCYRYVKHALAASPPGTKGQGLIPRHYSDMAALNASVTLKEKYGFINLLETAPYDKLLRKNPLAGPKGAVYVYSSTLPCKTKRIFIKDCGHVEINTGLTGKDAFVSDFPSSVPISETERNKKKKLYTLVSVLIKPGTK